MNTQAASIVTLTLLLAGCGGPAFTLATTADLVLPGEDSGSPVAIDGAGGDAGGVTTEDSGLPADQDSGAGDGAVGAHEDSGDGGADSSVAADSGERDTGATETDSGTGPSDSGLADADGGITPCDVTHSDGVGQTWMDCTALGTYSTGDEGTMACQTYAAAMGYPTSACREEYMCGSAGGGVSGSIAVVCPWADPENPLSSPCEGYCWALGPSAVYGVVYDCPAAGASAGSCTQASTWE